jgi:hypothetical protein
LRFLHCSLRSRVSAGHGVAEADGNRTRPGSSRPYTVLSTRAGLTGPVNNGPLLGAYLGLWTNVDNIRYVQPCLGASYPRGHGFKSRPRDEKAQARGLIGLGLYRIQTVFFRRFSRVSTDFSGTWSSGREPDATSRSNTRAASACMPGRTCWYVSIVKAGVA